MRAILVISVLSLLSLSALAQSGRRFPDSPKATPTPGSESTLPYSESTPNSERSSRFNDTSVQMPSIVGVSTTPDDGETLRVTTDLITIPVTVFDRSGIYISGLKQEDFKIFEDGVEQEIAYFGKTDKPVTVALLLDTSPSTQYRIEEIHQAAIAFVNELGPDDSVIVIEFNSSVKVQTKATKDRDKIRKAIYKAKFGDGTSLYNGVDEALRKQLAKIQGRKAVVLFTDGVDTTSRKNSYDSTVNYAEESDALIFPIYYNTFQENRLRAPRGFGRIIFGGVAGMSAEEYALGRQYLQDLADATGGRIFRPEATPGGLEAAFFGIAEELRRQYNIGYVPKDDGKAGQRKQIRVRVARSNVNVRARDSYVVGSSAAPSTAPEK